MHQKQKGRLIERSQYADVIYQNKVRSKTIMKYTEDDKPLWNTLMVSSKDNGAFIKL
jgi:hypothetical protein